MTDLTEEELIQWGRAIGESARVPMVIVLRGDLGTGKTTLARAIARGAGVTASIPSPTYNLLFRYPAEGERQVVHLDLYRLEHQNEVWALGWAELPAANEVVIVEWPERAESLLPVPRWEIILRETEDPGVRRVELRGVGDPPAISAPV